MLDHEGYRPNVGIILCNDLNQVFWARRCGRDGWQFPQGGVKHAETLEQALFREMTEEIGLESADVEVIGRTRDWLRYDIPREFRHGPRSSFRGQKQMWFLLRLTGSEDRVRFNSCPSPEFDAWRWVDYWQPLDEIVRFKREVYRQALTELEPLLLQQVR